MKPERLSVELEREEALARAEALALRVLAERIETARRFPNWAGFSRRHERVAGNAGQACARGVSSDRMEDQAPDGIAPDAGA